MKDRQLIVVLGMHRCGTSALTRGLMSLGVELGDRLLEANEKCNPKGFFEDIAFMEFNEKLLAVLESDWNSLIPLNKLLFLKPEVQALQQEAQELLKDRSEGSVLFGIKDPRLMNLLPFWQPVFKKLFTKISFVFSNRDPISVAKSLEKRDGFKLEKGFYLWFNHVYSALNELDGQDFIVVDFDRMLLNPQQELKRLAGFLQLECDPNSPDVIEYCQNFLESSLRHSKSDLQALKATATMPPAALELYELLLQLSADEISCQDQRVAQVVSSTKNAYLHLLPALAYLQDLESENKNFRLEIDRNLQELQQKKQETDDLIVQKNNQIDSLSSSLKQSEADAANLQNEIANLQNAHAKDTQTIQGILDSKSWKMTEPIRKFAALLKK